jgi:hypothetical protein
MNVFADSLPDYQSGTHQVGYKEEKTGKRRSFMGEKGEGFRATNPGVKQRAGGSGASSNLEIERTKAASSRKTTAMADVAKKMGSGGENGTTSQVPNTGSGETATEVFGTTGAVNRRLVEWKSKIRSTGNDAGRTSGVVSPTLESVGKIAGDHTTGIILGTGWNQSRRVGQISTSTVSFLARQRAQHYAVQGSSTVVTERSDPDGSQRSRRSGSADSVTRLRRSTSKSDTETGRKQVDQSLWESKRWRCCLAVAKKLNKAIHSPPFTMEVLETVLAMIEKHDSMSAGDMTAGYNHFVLHPSAYRWFCFKLDGVVYWMKVLFFGLAPAPYIFSKLMARVRTLWRTPTNKPGCLKEHGLRLSGYIDDLIVMAIRNELSEILRIWIWPVAAALGIVWGDKSSWEPEFRKKYLGHVIDSLQRQVELPSHVKESLDHRFSYLVKQNGRVQGRTFISLMSTALAYRAAITNCKLFVWTAMMSWRDMLKARLFGSRLWKKGVLELVWEEMLEDYFQLTDAELIGVQFLHHAVKNHGQKWTLENVVKILVDASPTGVGAKALGHDISVRFTEEELKELGGKQVRRELKGVQKALEVMRTDLAGKAVEITSDCLGQVQAMNRLRNGALAGQVASLYWWCIQENIRLVPAAWIPGTRMIELGVDGLSRWEDVGDFHLKPSVWDLIRFWEPRLEVDRFASDDNAKLERFNSWKRGYRQEAVDALRQDWRNVWNFACLPLKLIPKVVQLVIAQEANTVLVIPEWTQTWWWTRLHQLAGPKHWLQLGPGQDVFLPGPSGHEKVSSSSWKFWAVRVIWTTC